MVESAVPAAIKATIEQAVLGAEWWLPVKGSYWREPEGPGTDVFAAAGYRGNHPGNANSGARMLHVLSTRR